MAGRRLLTFLVLLLLIALLAGAVAPRERGDAPSPTAPSALEQRPASPERVVAAMPEQREVRAELGSVVELRVSHDEVDEVEIVALGLQAPVEPELAAEIVLVADQAGRFDVTLRHGGDRIGTLVVDEPAG